MIRAAVVPVSSEISAFQSSTGGRCRTRTVHPLVRRAHDLLLGQLQLDRPAAHGQGAAQRADLRERRDRRMDPALRRRRPARRRSRGGPATGPPPGVPRPTPARPRRPGRAATARPHAGRRAAGSRRPRRARAGAAAPSRRAGTPSARAGAPRCPAPRPARRRHRDRRWRSARGSLRRPRSRAGRRRRPGRGPWTPAGRSSPARRPWRRPGPAPQPGRAAAAAAASASTAGGNPSGRPNSARTAPKSGAALAGVGVQPRRQIQPAASAAASPRRYAGHAPSTGRAATPRAPRRAPAPRAAPRPTAGISPTAHVRGSSVGASSSRGNSGRAPIVTAASVRSSRSIGRGRSAERGAGVEVDGVDPHLAGPQPQHVRGQDPAPPEVHARRPGLLGHLPDGGGEPVRRRDEVGADLGGRALGTGLDVRVALLACWCRPGSGHRCGPRSSRLISASALRATWVSTCARVQSGSDDGLANASSPIRVIIPRRCAAPSAAQGSACSSVGVTVALPAASRDPGSRPGRRCGSCRSRRSR